MGQGAAAGLSWPRSCLPLAGPHEEMWQQGPAFHGLPRRWARGQVSGLALGEPGAADPGKAGCPASGSETRIKGYNLGLGQGLAGPG